jgi:hypothetical protein
VGFERVRSSKAGCWQEGACIVQFCGKLCMGLLKRHSQCLALESMHACMHNWTLGTGGTCSHMQHAYTHTIKWNKTYLMMVPEMLMRPALRSGSGTTPKRTTTYTQHTRTQPVWNLIYTAAETSFISHSSFSLITVGSGFHCLRFFLLLITHVRRGLCSFMPITGHQAHGTFNTLWVYT